MPRALQEGIEALCLFHGEQAKHLLKDYATMKGYIHSTLAQQSKAQNPTPKFGDPMDDAQEEDNKFPKAEHCLMFFGGSKAYESRWQSCITEQEVNTIHTLATSTWL